MYRTHQFIQAAVLQQIASDTELARCQYIAVVFRRRENSDISLRVILYDAQHSREPLAAAHMHLYQQNVGLEAAGHRMCLIAVCSLAYNVNTGLSGKKACQSLPEQVVAVCDEHPDLIFSHGHP